MKDSYIFFLLLIGSLVTIFLRAFPFVVLKGKSFPLLDYLGKVLPYALIGMLVVYCLKDMSFLSLNGFVPEVICVLCAGISYWKKGNMLLSIALATVIYMILVQKVF